ncbi:MAG TPA: hypothetical protein VEW46_22200 [Pyrinomonadaceae bacterium]|nr:hypothetical protein [Pyrinomonadaceae bacterium]
MPKAPAYLPFKTFLSALDRLAQGMPNEVDKECFPTYSSVVQGQIIGALRFFELIDDNGVPNGTVLERLAQQKTVGGRKANLLPLLKSGYSEVIKLDLAKLTPSKLDAAFENYAISGDTKRRAKTFFIHAAQFVGLGLSPLLTRRTRSLTGKKKRPARPTDPELATRHQESIGTNSDESVTIQLSGGVTLTVTLAGKLLRLNKQDREFAFGIIDSIISHKNVPSSEL